MRSFLTLRLRLLMLWLFTLVVCAALGYIILSIYRSGTEARTERTVALARQACGSLQVQYPRSIEPGSTKIDKVLMEALLNAVLDSMSGLEGGYWHASGGFIAYAFPTHEGSEAKVDVPSTERARIEALVRTSFSSREPAIDLLRGSRETVVLVACPVEGFGAELGAWTMARVPTAASKAYDEATRGLGLLLLFVVASGAWLSYSYYRWSYHFRRIESALRGASGGVVPEIAAAHDTELDRIIAALNDFSSRLQASRRRASELNASLDRAERFAALGRMAASLAHEVRNPIAAIRLRVENALVQPEKQEPALRAVLREVERVDTTVKTLLSQAEPTRVRTEEVSIPYWIEEQTGAFSERCAARGVVFSCGAKIESWRFDPQALGRALGILLDNALDHTPAGGDIALTLRETDHRGMIVRVRDSGSGVAAEVKERLFEPFVSARPDGVGLGLAIVQEIAAAHGGSARYVEQSAGACFELEIPWAAS